MTPERIKEIELEDISNDPIVIELLDDMKLNNDRTEMLMNILDELSEDSVTSFRNQLELKKTIISLKSKLKVSDLTFEMLKEMK